jgi:hypothetical protein
MSPACLKSRDSLPWSEKRALIPFCLWHTFCSASRRGMGKPHLWRNLSWQHSPFLCSHFPVSTGSVAVYKKLFCHALVLRGAMKPATAQSGATGVHCTGGPLSIYRLLTWESVWKYIQFIMLRKHILLVGTSFTFYLEVPDSNRETTETRRICRPVLKVKFPGRCGVG